MNSEPAKPSASPSDHKIDQRCEITLQNPCRYRESGARLLRPWIERLVADQAPAALTFTVRFVSDREMRRLNGTYRDLDKSTDVLTFPGDWEPSVKPEAGVPGPVAPTAMSRPGAPHLGDVVISVPVARRQAGQQGHSVQTELQILMLHGVLHCLGYDHETDNGAMDSLERRLRLRYIHHD